MIMTWINSSSSDSNHYERLEKVTQKYEGEIRNHIRVKSSSKLAYAYAVRLSNN